MYHKAIIMELKDQYALVMAEEGEILRVRRKKRKIEGTVIRCGNRLWLLWQRLLFS